LRRSEKISLDAIWSFFVFISFIFVFSMWHAATLVVAIRLTWTRIRKIAAKTRYIAWR